MFTEMKKLKTLLFFLSLLSFAVPSFAQKGFKVIDKAERKFEKGKNRRALKLLSKAEKMNYGFCGNAWIEAEIAIDLLRAKIYMDQKKYQLARNSLDSISWGFGGDCYDSIRIRSYQLEYGKDSLNSMIDTSLANATMHCNEYDCFVSIPLTNGNTIKLKEIPISFNNVINSEVEKQNLKKWIIHFKESENYKLILENSGAPG